MTLNNDSLEEALEKVVHSVGLEKLYSDLIYTIYYLKVSNNTKEMAQVNYVIDDELFQIKLRQANFKTICIKAIDVLEEKELYEVCKIANYIIND
jgi:hypothetical protein